MSALLLDRLQFAFTIGFHFIFAPLSIGLSVLLVLAERRYYTSGLEVDRFASTFWLKLLVATVAIGVATGVPMEFSFGTNWSNYSRFVGGVFGAPLAIEGLLAFFLESTFIGVLIFGRKRVSKRVYYLSAWLVAIGAHLSAVWILIANSWQQTPDGYKVVGGRAEITSAWSAMVNYSTVPRVLHTVLAAWVIGAFVVISISAYYILRGRHLQFAHRSLPSAIVVGLIAAVMLPFIGHWSAVVVAQHQPAKLAAMEGLYKTQEGAPLYLFGWVDTAGRKVYGPYIPNLLSGLAKLDPYAEIRGMDEFPGKTPPVQIVFQSWHLMVALGLLFVLVMLVAAWLLWRRRLAYHRWFLWIMVLVVPLPWVATMAGWTTAEVGRQPWVVYNLMRTSQGASPTVTTGQVASTLGLFVLIYAVLFLAWLWVMVGIVKKGPEKVPVELPRTGAGTALAGAQGEVT
ncbi:MAG: cytochrome ubiquinol oxidase subunit I [Thermoleophilia bacterium]